jgi:hypothetical protein
MKSITITYGKEQASKMHNGQKLSAAEEAQFVKSYNFKTEKEAQAFIKGVEEAVGWQEVYIEE